MDQNEPSGLLCEGCCDIRGRTRCANCGLTFSGALISIGPLLLPDGTGEVVSFVLPVSFLLTALTAALGLLSGLLGYMVAAGGGLLGYGGTSER